MVQHISSSVSVMVMEMKLGWVGDMPCLNAFSIKEMKMSGAMGVWLSGLMWNSVSIVTCGETRMRISSM